jgi:vitamin B12/bleomycin/antimicrobial peptide transport system ATP-binding/permease protein
MISQRLPINRLTWARFTQAVKNFATSEVGGTAKLLFAALIALLLGSNGLNVVNSYVGRNFFTAIEQRSLSGFIWQALLYVGVFAGSTAVAVLYRFTEERLGLLWREWLTQRLILTYLDHPIYYRVSDSLLANGEIANPDQRIADDVRAFTVTTLSFVLLFLNGTFTAVAFAGVMWSISPLLFGVGVGYAAIGSLLTIGLGHRLIGLNYAQLDKEADLRSDLIHVREHAESVALLGYGERLSARLSRRVEDLTGNFRRIIAVNRNLGFFTTGYNYLIQIIPALIVAPLFIRGEAEFGVIPQSAMAFSHLLGAFSLIITQFQSISSFTAVIARLGALAEALERAQAVTVLTMEECGHRRRTVECPICLEHAAVLPAMPTLTIHEENGRVAYERLTLRSPQEGRILVDGLSLSIPAGTHVLIVGPNDAAKLALFRATAGIWEVGDGRIIRPGLDRIMFLPERPYLPPITLRELLVRPGHEHAVTDDQITTTLRELNLEPLLARVGGLDAKPDWDDLLSLSEQQLLALARLVLATPEFAFLDRIDTTLDPDQMDQILRTLREHSITYLTIGDDHGAAGQYDTVLTLAADGTWEWKAMDSKHDGADLTIPTPESVRIARAGEGERLDPAPGPR